MSHTEIIYGFNSVMAALTNDAGNIIELWVDRERKDVRMNNLLKLAQQHGVMVHKVETRALQRRVGEQRHQGVVAAYRSAAPMNEHQLLELVAQARKPPLLLILDGVTDPHNLGACIRTAEAAGVDAVVVPRDRAAGLTSTARKVASGSAERMPFVAVTNLARCLRDLKEQGVWLFGLDGEARDDIYAFELSVPLALVLGAEGSGLRRLTRELCDQMVSLPMAGLTESLNVSVAAGICLYEVVRQRKR